MGFKTFGFGCGREDIWEPEEIFWGPEDTWLGDERYSGDRELANPLGAVQMGLIYVNPEGPNGNPDPLAAARDIRETFARMAMNDEETRRADRRRPHFGKTHGAVDRDSTSAPSPRPPRSSSRASAGRTASAAARAPTRITSGLEGAWTNEPTKWDNGFFDNLFGYDWELTKSPAGAKQWTPKDPEAQGTVPDAHDPSKRHAPMMLTTDLALRIDPVYGPISKRFHENPDQLADAFAQGLVQAAAPRHGAGLALPRPVGSGAAALAGPGPGGRPRADRRARHRRAEGARSSPRACPSPSWSRPPGRRRRPSAAPTSAAAPTARGSASRRRRTGRSTNPAELAKVLETLERIQQDFNGAQSGGKQVSLADLIVLGGCAAVEQAAQERPATT